MRIGKLSSAAAQGQVLPAIQHDELHQLSRIPDFTGAGKCTCFKGELFKIRWKGLQELLVCWHDSPVVRLLCLQTKLETPHLFFQVNLQLFSMA